MTFIEHTREPREFGAASAASFFHPFSETGEREASQFNTTRKSAHVCLNLGQTHNLRSDCTCNVRLHAADEKPVYRRPRTRSSWRLGACQACGLPLAYPNAKRAAELHAIHVPRSRVASRAKDYVDVIEDMMPHRHDVDELASALGKGVDATVEVRPRRPADPLFIAIHTGFGTGCQDVVSLACRTAPSGST